MRVSDTLPADRTTSTTRLVRRCNEHQAGYRPARLRRPPDPRTHRRAAQWVRGRHHRAVAVNVPARSREIGQHKQSRSHSSMPPESVGRDASREANFLVVLAQRALDRHDLGLHLDDKERACRLVPDEQVNRASLAILGVRNLCPGDPPRSLEDLGDAADESRVAFVHQAIEVAATPSKGDNQFRVEGSRDCANPSEGHVLDAPTFDPGHHVLRLAAAGSQILLRPGSAVAEPANTASDPRVVHRRHYGERRLAATYSVRWWRAIVSVRDRHARRGRRHRSPRFCRGARGAGVPGRSPRHQPHRPSPRGPGAHLDPPRSRAVRRR